MCLKHGNSDKYFKRSLGIIMNRLLVINSWYCQATVLLVVPCRRSKIHGKNLSSSMKLQRTNEAAPSVDLFTIGEPHILAVETFELLSYSSHAILTQYEYLSKKLTALCDYNLFSNSAKVSA